MTQALLTGDPREGGVIMGTARQLVGALLPGDRD
jgi:hypothetical protein